MNKSINKGKVFDVLKGTTQPDTNLDHMFLSPTQVKFILDEYYAGLKEDNEDKDEDYE